MRLLLINPRFPESFWSFKWAMDTVVGGRKTINPPLGLATLAALCPPDWEVTICDENVETLPLAPEADIVGICGMGVQFSRQRELLAYYRNSGYFVVAGGSYASLCPEEYVNLADTVVAGEAEYIWKEFCREYPEGKQRALYQETGSVSLADSPVPRFDLLKLDRYQAVSLQFSRGCPFRCEFCDIIVMFGRVPRTKPVEQVGRELDELRKLGVHNAFFVDDNLIGNKRTAKDLLRYLKEYQDDRNYHFRFGTEASLNLAQDKELLELFPLAGMEWVFIGIESPDEASLVEAQKLQNTRQDILTSIRTVYQAGLDIFAGFIIGFDNDTVETFERQFQFITKSGIQASMIGLLTATPKTPLHERLAKAGRLIAGANQADNTKLGTNVMPKGMTYDEMLSGYRVLHQRLYSDAGIANRIRNKLKYLTPPTSASRYTPRETVGLLWRILVHGLLPGGIGRVTQFVRSLPLTRPKLIHQAIEDWVVGLAMRDYIERHLRESGEKSREKVRSHARVLEQKLRRYRENGALEVQLSELRNRATELSLRLRGALDRGFYTRAARQLERVLQQSTSSVSLHIDYLQEKHQRHLQQLLRRLSRHGDRIRITVNARVRHLVDIDSSVFLLSFEA
ncbi:MAG: radical SAM protein [Gemmatimonadota bacterium]